MRRAALLAAALASVSAACSSGPAAITRDAGVNRIFATVKGVT